MLKLMTTVAILAATPVMAQTSLTDDPLSPTTLVHNYIDQIGIAHTAGSIRQAVEINARDPAAFGPDPIAGLRNTLP